MKKLWLLLLVLAALVPLRALAVNERVCVGGVEMTGGEYWLQTPNGEWTTQNAAADNYTAFYDAGTQTLHLCDAKIQMEGTGYLKGIELKNAVDEMTIVLQGENEITLFVPKQKDRLKPIKVKGKVQYVNLSDDDEQSCGIYAEELKHLIIRGPGSLDISLHSADAAYGVLVRSVGKVELQNANVSIRNDEKWQNGHMLWADRLHMDGAELYGESFLYGLENWDYTKIQLKNSVLTTRNIRNPLVYREKKRPGSMLLENSVLHIEGAETGVQVEDLESRNSSVFIQAEENGIEALQNLYLYGGDIVVGAGQYALAAGGDIMIDDGAQVNVRGGEDGVYSTGSITLQTGSLQAEGGQYAVRVRHQEEGHRDYVPENFERMFFSKKCLQKAGLERRRGDWVYQGLHREYDVWERQIYLVDEEGNPCTQVVLRQDKAWKTDLTPETSEWEEAGIAVLLLVALVGMIALMWWGRKAKER